MGALGRRAPPSARLRAVLLRRPVLDPARAEHGGAVSLGAAGAAERLRARADREADHPVGNRRRHRFRRRAGVHARPGPRSGRSSPAGSRGRSAERQHRRRAGWRPAADAVRVDGIRPRPPGIRAHAEPVRAVHGVRRHGSGRRGVERRGRQGPVAGSGAACDGVVSQSRSAGDVRGHPAHRRPAGAGGGVAGSAGQRRHPPRLRHHRIAGVAGGVRRPHRGDESPAHCPIT